MPALLSVNAVYAGMQPDGHWAHTPSLIIQLIDHQPLQETLDNGGFPLIPSWDIDESNRVSHNKLVSKATSSAHWSLMGSDMLAALACNYRERHVVIAARDPWGQNILPLVQALTSAGRLCQIEGLTMPAAIAQPPGAWLTLIMLPVRGGDTETQSPPAAAKPSDVIAGIRWRSDLDRVERLWGHRKVPVWLHVSAYADKGTIFRQCRAVAMRHVGWRVVSAS